MESGLRRSLAWQTAQVHGDSKKSYTPHNYSVERWAVSTTHQAIRSSGSTRNLALKTFLRSRGSNCALQRLLCAVACHERLTVDPHQVHRSTLPHFFHLSTLLYLPKYTSRHIHSIINTHYAPNSKFVAWHLFYVTLAIYSNREKFSRIFIF